MFTLNCRGQLLVLDEPKVMGILNITPDSFYAGSRVHDASDILFRAGQMITEGAAILDIGGQSTRPGSEPVGVEEELQRVIPAIEIVRKEFPRQLISVDTYYARVAAEAVAAGASIVNDVSAGAMDDELISTVASLRVPYVLMHMKGHPQTMQMNPEYENVTREVFDSLQQQLPILSSAGIADIIVDPGFGFGKTIAHNFTLLGELHLLAQLEKPVLVGISRKSTIYKTLGITAAEALNGTTVLHTIALLNGASILRVHDVREAVQAIRLVKACTDKKQLTELLFTLPHG